MTQSGNRYNSRHSSTSVQAVNLQMLLMLLPLDSKMTNGRQVAFFTSNCLKHFLARTNSEVSRDRIILYPPIESFECRRFLQMPCHQVVLFVEVEYESVAVLLPVIDEYP